MRFPSFISVASFWMVGIPIGLVLTFHESWGVLGLWVGLDASAWVMVLGMGWCVLHVCTRAVCL